MVLQGMSLEERAVGEGAVADGAGEGALHAVCAHVNVQRALLREALAADGALERPHTSVHHHVLQQIVTQREGAPADAALVRLLTCTNTHRHMELMLMVLKFLQQCDDISDHYLVLCKLHIAKAANWLLLYT